MPRPPKSLYRHALDGTFRPERHSDLLLTEPLPDQFAAFGERYRGALSERERRAIALALRDAVARPAGERGPVRVELDLRPR